MDQIVEPISGVNDANVLTDVKPSFDPQMGIYQLCALLCKVSKVENLQIAE